MCVQEWRQSPPPKGAEDPTRNHQHPTTAPHHMIESQAGWNLVECPEQSQTQEATNVATSRFMFLKADRNSHSVNRIRNGALKHVTFPVLPASWSRFGLIPFRSNLRTMTDGKTENGRKCDTVHYYCWSFLVFKSLAA